MSENWTAYDWGLNKASVGDFADYEERLLNGIDKRMRKTTKR